MESEGPNDPSVRDFIIKLCPGGSESECGSATQVFSMLNEQLYGTYVFSTIRISAK